MRLLVIQLSDIHIKTDHDLVLFRWESIANAALSMDHSIEAVLIALTGDIAFSGKEEQYWLALEFIDKLIARAKAELFDRYHVEIPIFFVAVPGNHDCDFDINTDVRRILLEEKTRSKLTVPDVSAQLTKSQEPFFDFLGATSNPSPTINSDADRLVYTYEFKVGAESVGIMCINTAWLSQIHEQPGSLYFPTLPIVSYVSKHSLVISMHHHPSNWLEPNNGREFRQAVEKISDIVLTGHEHETFKREQRNIKGEENTFIEGGMLQESGASTVSAFNSFIIDTSCRKQKFYCFRWSEERNHYLPDQYLVPALADDDGWEEFAINKKRKRNSFEISRRFLEQLENPGIKFTHSTRGSLLLSDIFVYPDLREVRLLRNDLVGNQIKGEQVVEFVTRHPQLLISGDSQSGKTSLAKMLFRDLHTQGMVPLLFTPRQSLSSKDGLHRSLEEVFCLQYDHRELEEFKQLSKNRKAIIIDDYDKILSGLKGRANIAQALGKFAAHVILIADSISVEVHELLRSELQSTDSKHYQIKSFGHVRRNRIVEKWLSLRETEVDKVEFTRQLNYITKTLDTLIGKNFVPAYPLFILSVLQASEAATPIDTSASTHGYYYELFIRVSLARGRTNNEFDIAAAYLANLAYNFFIDRKLEIDQEELQRIHEYYEESHDISIDFERKKRDLLGSEILIERDEKFRFKHDWVYYYFVASYIKEHIDLENIRSHISKLCRNVYVTEYANILLFLAHLCKDRFIIAELIETAKSVFPEYESARFSDDVKFLSGIEKVAEALTYDPKEPSEGREAAATARDGVDDMHIAYDLREELTPEELSQNPLIRMNFALKTLQILGQVLKNFPGSLNGETKLQIARECYGVGLRAASSVLSLLRDNEKTYLHELVQLIAEGHPDFSLHEIKDKALETVARIGFWTSFGIVKRIAQAVGSPELTRTYDRLKEEIDSPVSKLIFLSIRFDQFLDFPHTLLEQTARDLSANPLAMWTLRSLVIEHFNLFPIDMRTKGRVCAKLDIRLRNAQLGEWMGERLLPAHSATRK